MSGAASMETCDDPRSRASDAAAAQAPVSGVEHWPRKGEVRLFLWEKFVDSPEAKPAVLFVHGSSMASQPTFDLRVPGRVDSSVMDWFARRGFACWSVDMEGYGRSDKSRDITCDIANGADDLTADRVESELERRSARFVRVDLSDSPQRITASARWDGSSGSRTCDGLPCATSTRPAPPSG